LKYKFFEIIKNILKKNFNQKVKKSNKLKYNIIKQKISGEFHLYSINERVMLDSRSKLKNQFLSMSCLLNSIFFLRIFGEVVLFRKIWISVFDLRSISVESCFRVEYYIYILYFNLELFNYQVFKFLFN